MEKRVVAMYGTHHTMYAKAIYSPNSWGFRCDIDMDESGWEFTLQVLCFQLWIGA